MMNRTEPSNDQCDSRRVAHPILPPLYFFERNGLTSHGEQQHEAINNGETVTLQSLPCEIISHCANSFLDWGDLSKLATVQKSWRNIVRDAANHGGAESRWELSQCLMEGTNGLPQNSKLAITYLTELATCEKDNESKHFITAVRKLAKCYLTGDGVEQNSSTGISWLEKAYHRGDDEDAAHELAQIYEYSKHGVTIDIVVAADWFRRSAERGHIEGMAEYAMCCELGCGREQNDHEALEWYMKAANAGHVEANFSVGEAFEEARGVPQSDEEACLWYYKAAVMGDEDSKIALGRLQGIARIVLPGWQAAVLAD